MFLQLRKKCLLCNGYTTELVEVYKSTNKQELKRLADNQVTLCVHVFCWGKYQQEKRDRFKVVSFTNK